MTFEERDQLSRLLQLLVQAQPGPKDPEAQALISEAFMRQPDAAYLLVQRVIQLEHALQAAQRPGFSGDPNSWGRAPVAMQPATQAPPQPMQQTPAPVAAAPQSAWGSGIFGTVASTAAGVLAGSMLAQGIGSLFGGHHGGDRSSLFNDNGSTVPPGGGTLVETDYGGAQNDDGDYVAEDFADDGGDPGGDVG